MPDQRFRFPNMQAPRLFIDVRLVDRHPHAMPEMFCPCGNLVLETEHATLIQTLVNPALKRAVATKGRLHLLDQDPELLAVIVGNEAPIVIVIGPSSAGTTSRSWA